jgi:hypothetical protein
MGIGAAVAAIGSGIADVLGGGALAAGIGTAVGTGVVGAGIGAAGGGAISAIEGKPVLGGALTGAEVGGITGLGVGAGGALGAASGIGATAGGVLGGAAGGALGGAVTGTSPLLGAAGGAVSGGVTALTAPAGAGPAAAPADAGGGSVGGPGPGAVGTAAPASVIGDSAGLANTDPAAGLVASGGAPGNAVPPPGPGTEMAPQDAATLQSSMGRALAGGTADSAFTTSTDAGAPNVQTITGLGNPTVPATASSPGAVANPELGDSTGFSPGGASESAPTGGGFLANLTGNTVTGTAANTDLGIGGGTGTGAGAAASKTTNWGNFSNDPFGTVGSALSNNASWLVPAAGLGYSAIKANTPTPATTNLQNQATQASTNSTALENYVTTGTLPAGVQNSITSASNAAKASIRSQYASRGMSGSSAEAQDLAAVDQRASAQGGQIAIQLLQSGISEAGLASNIYSQLLQNETQQDTALQGAVSSFASSLVPRAPTNITLQAAG